MTESTALPSPVLQGVVYVIEVADRPGLVHAIAAVFAHRGLSMRAFFADTSRSPPRILVLFRGTPRQCRMVGQVLVRLHDVHSLRIVDENAAELRAMALCRPTAPWPAFEEVEVQALGETCLMSGRHAAVEAALARLTADGLVTGVSRALVAL
jgi:hypothetical protein